MWTTQTLAVTQNLAQKDLPITGHVRLAEVNVYHEMFFFPNRSLLTESTWPYPAPRQIITPAQAPAPETFAGCVKERLNDPQINHLRFCISPCNGWLPSWLHLHCRWCHFGIGENYDGRLRGKDYMMIHIILGLHLFFHSSFLPIMFVIL